MLPRRVEVATASASDADCTAVVVSATHGDLDHRWSHLRRSGFNADVGEVIRLPGSDRDVILVGVGPAGSDLSPGQWRMALGTGVASARQHSSIAVEAFPGVDAAPACQRAAASAVGVAAAAGTRWARPAASGPAITIVSEGHHSAEWRQSVGEGLEMANGVNIARALVNEPSTTLNPKHAADAVGEIFAGTDVEVSVLRADQEGLTGLSAVAAGSATPPILVELTRRCPSAELSIALAGKGVTFDSGGLSIKTAEQLVDMKADMAGAAAVVGALRALAALEPAVEVRALVPLTENVVGSSAFRPGDILEYPNGKSVEITNTDAEGRLILADALLRAQAAGPPDVIIDMATLTYGCVAALGRDLGGLFTDDQQLAAVIDRAGLRSGDRIWRLPIEFEYARHNRSHLADMANLPSHPDARAITAALFLKEFIEPSQRWAHLDMYGPAMISEARGDLDEGATGWGTRLLVETVLELAGRP